MKLLILSGANLNNLGKRKVIYGDFTYADMCGKVDAYCVEKGVIAEFAQSNYEGALVELVQNTDADGVIINAGAYSHYSYAIRDALEDKSLPAAEVHLTDIFNREPFRRTRVFEGVVDGCFCGEGITSYFKAVSFVITLLSDKARGRGKK